MTYERKKNYCHMKKTLSLLILSAILLSGCHTSPDHYVIGVSQCSEDIWRDKLNDELRMACYAHEDVDLIIASANDNSERQMQQINDFIEQKVDLLIISPNQLSNISAAIDRAAQNGIPVILFDRKSDSDNYTAFIGADNYEMGRTIGEYMAKQLHGSGNIIEIQGLKGSSPAIERHSGFISAISHYPDLHLLTTLESDWTEEGGRKAMETWLHSARPTQNINYVFAQNDRMAVGARKALISSRRNIEGIFFTGIDGLPGQGGGLELVRDGILEVSYIYPTGGDQVIQLAMSILRGRAFEKINYLETALITRDNASVLLMQAKEISRQAHSLETIHQMAGRYASMYALQRTALLLLIAIISILTVFAIVLIRLNRSKALLNRQLERRNEEIEQQKIQLEQSQESERRLTDTLQQISRTQTPFISRLKTIVLDHVSDPDFNVVQLADEMAMSRVQLYRKVKVQTGLSAVEFIRNVRLEQARQLFEETDLNVSQVADRTGFPTLQYFIKCFREEFGYTPKDYIKKQQQSPKEEAATPNTDL